MADKTSIVENHFSLVELEVAFVFQDSLHELVDADHVLGCSLLVGFTAGGCGEIFQVDEVFGHDARGKDKHGKARYLHGGWLWVLGREEGMRCSR